MQADAFRQEESGWVPCQVRLSEGSRIELTDSETGDTSDIALDAAMRLSMPYPGPPNGPPLICIDLEGREFTEHSCLKEDACTDKDLLERLLADIEESSDSSSFTSSSSEEESDSDGANDELTSVRLSPHR